jgi:hypothetical protein
VLEFGAGEGSTLAFLDRTCFPELETIVSLENDADWAQRVVAMAQGDPRLSLKIWRGHMAKAAAEQDLNAYDVIFIDDSRTIEDRSATIAAVAKRRPRRGVVVMHDFEILEYRYAALPFRRNYRVTGLSPNVGVAWNQGRVPKRPMRMLNRLLHGLPGSLQHKDPRSWLAWLETAGVPRLCN